LVSVENINSEEVISIFPNPTNRQLIISIEDGIIEGVNIFNQTGQIVINEKSGNWILDVSNLQPGMYVIEIMTDKQIIRKKLMVE